MSFFKSTKNLWRLVKTLEQYEPMAGQLLKDQGNKEREVEIAYKSGFIDQHQFERIKSLWTFCKLASQAKEISEEWKRIQQDEHDFNFAFQSHPTEDTQSRYLYRKGIADGIKWCINRFS